VQAKRGTSVNEINMDKKEAKKKRDFHKKRVEFYQKKINDSNKPAKIGFKIGTKN
jgi:hypothetical protein